MDRNTHAPNQGFGASLAQKVEEKSKEIAEEEDVVYGSIINYGISRNYATVLKRRNSR